MAERAVQRRLTTIVSLDVAGYSRLMEADEEGTLAAFQSHRNELIDPAIASYGGHIVKSLGDGLLIEFPSVVEAVVCAADIQRAMSARNADVAHEQRIDVRIGVNLGDVIVEDGDIHGDGVNMAARLQSLAAPGGICVADSVHSEVQGKNDPGLRRCRRARGQEYRPAGARMDCGAGRRSGQRHIAGRNAGKA